MVKEVTRKIEEQLEQEVSNWLYRGFYERRHEVTRRSQARCQKCGSQKACQFLHNGYRERQLVTQFGGIHYRLPRVRCACGGSVRIPFSMMKAHQQIWDDVVTQIHHWADLGLSLRQMLDAIWLTLLAPTGATQADRLQRQRAVKSKQKVCVLVALGLYPQSGRWGVLGWQIAAEESQQASDHLLIPLETRGLYRQRGLELFPPFRVCWQR